METVFVTNHSQFVHAGYYTNHGSVNVTNASFCNVTLTYTHPGQDDKVNVQVWLPADNWNGRLQAVGGGGWQAGLYTPSLMGMTAAVGEGYSTISTDAGLGSHVYPKDWALLSPGNVNLYLLQNLASVSLNDMAVIGKAVSTSFYGQPPRYSYFSGCSQGGRQGMMLAQRYPDAFDGIAASAPAINWSSFVMSDFWPTLIMRMLGEYPPACEFDAITDAVLDACDGLDGIADGIITNVDACHFNPMSVVGKNINCSTIDGAPRSMSAAAATIMHAAVSCPGWPLMLKLADLCCTSGLARKRWTIRQFGSA
jgi:feruloyl esterase